jgi:hypothetical protein
MRLENVSSVGRQFSKHSRERERSKMKYLVLSALMVLAAACSSNNSGPDATTGTDSGNNNKDSGSTGTDSGTPDSGSTPDSGTTPDSGSSVIIFYGGGDAGMFTITTPALVVDNDNSENNNPELFPNPTASSSDQLFAAVLAGAGLPYSIWVVPGDSSGNDRPNQTDLAGVSLVLWYTGANNSGSGNGTMTTAQETALISWLNEGGKTLAIFSEYLVYDVIMPGNQNWTGTPTDTLFSTYIGASGEYFDPDVYVGPPDGGMDTQLTSLSPYFNVVGAGTLNMTNYNVIVASCNPQLVDTHVSIINPNTGMLAGAGIDTLATMQADPNMTGANLTAPVALGHKNFTATGGGKSTVVFVGFPAEDINPTTTKGMTTMDFFEGLGAYLGL